MPTVNIPSRLRFALYLAGVIGSSIVSYSTAKGWTGDAEVTLWSALAAVLFTLAAAKTSLNPNEVHGVVEITTGGDEPPVRPSLFDEPDERGASDLVAVVAVVAIAVLAAMAFALLR